MTSSVLVCQRIGFVEEKAQLTIQKQCQLLGVSRSSYYHKPNRKPHLKDQLLLESIDRIYMEDPSYGSRRIGDELRTLGYRIGRVAT